MAGLAIESTKLQESGRRHRHHLKHSSVEGYGPLQGIVKRRGQRHAKRTQESVDTIEAIIKVIQANLKDLIGLWTDTRPPVTLDAIRAYSAPGSQNRKDYDWAGVEGTWRRYVCFMDYRYVSASGILGVS